MIFCLCLVDGVLDLLWDVGAEGAERASGLGDAELVTSAALNVPFGERLDRLEDGDSSGFSALVRTGPRANDWSASTPMA